LLFVLQQELEMYDT